MPALRTSDPGHGNAYHLQSLDGYNWPDVAYFRSQAVEVVSCPSKINTMMTHYQNLNDRREKALNQLSQQKADIERIAATGVPLLHLDTELVKACPHFVLAEIERRTPLMESGGDVRTPISSQDQEGVALTYEPQGMTCLPQYDPSPYAGEEDGKKWYEYPDYGDSLNYDTSPNPFDA